MEKKKVIISVTNDLVHDRRMHRSIEVLADMDYEVVFVGRRFKDSDHFSLDNCTIKRFKCIWNKGPLFYLEYNIRLFIWLLSQNPTTLLSVDLDTLLACSFIKQLTGCRLVVDLHEYYTEVPELRGKGIRKKIWGRIEKYGISRSDQRYTVSETIAGQYENLYGRKFEVVRNFPKYQQDIPRLARPGENFTLLYLGAINMGRGLTQILEVIRDLDDIRLIVAGKGDLYDVLKEKSKDFGLSDRVEFLGWVSPDQIPAICQRAHIGINILAPSSKSYYYSLANKTFDYIHAGLPTLAMAFPEYKKINQEYETSLLISNLETETITKAIKQLQSDQILYNKLQGQCLEARKVYNWDQEKLKLISIFKHL